MKYKCTQCGKLFEGNSYTGRAKNPFCTSKCYGKWQKGKSFRDQGKEERPKKYCSQEGCNEIHFGRGYCKKHYSQFVEREKEIKMQCVWCGKVFILSGKKKYCSWKCVGLRNRKAYIFKKGYKKILHPTHKRADRKGYVFEHIIVLEKKLNRSLYPNEVTHHIDGNKRNNSPDNLTTFKNQSIHMNYHRPPKIETGTKA